MRQQRWVEFLGSYDFDIAYHEGKGNVMADALSRRHVTITLLMLKEYESLQTLSGFDLTRESTSGVVCLCSLVITPSLITRVVKAQNRDSKLACALEYLINNTLDTCLSEWSVGTDGGLRFLGRLCVPNDPEIIKEVLSEAHRSPFAIHPGGMKMYQDLKRTFWWE